MKGDGISPRQQASMTVPNPKLKLPDPSPAEPGDYKGGDDPYTYRVSDDGSITILGGAIGQKDAEPLGGGEPMSKDSSEYAALLGRIREGQLKKVETSLADEAMSSIRKNMRE